MKKFYVYIDSNGAEEDNKFLVTISDSAISLFAFIESKFEAFKKQLGFNGEIFKEKRAMIMELSDFYVVEESASHIFEKEIQELGLMKERRPDSSLYFDEVMGKELFSKVIGLTILTSKRISYGKFIDDEVKGDNSLQSETYKDQFMFIRDDSPKNKVVMGYLRSDNLQNYLSEVSRKTDDIQLKCRIVTSDFVNKNSWILENMKDDCLVENVKLGIYEKDSKRLLKLWDFIEKNSDEVKIIIK